MIKQVKVEADSEAEVIVMDEYKNRAYKNG